MTQHQAPLDYPKYPEPVVVKYRYRRLIVVVLTVVGWAVVIALAAVAYMMAAAILTAAHAHDAPSGMPYPRGCCNGWKPDGTGDCAPIPSSSVKATPDGWVITIAPGDHPLATKPHVFTKDFGKELPSIDGSYHLCLYPTEYQARCFLAPEPGA